MPRAEPTRSRPSDDRAQPSAGQMLDFVMGGRRSEAAFGIAVALAIPAGVVGAMMWRSGSPPPPPAPPMVAAVLPTPPAPPDPPPPAPAPPSAEFAPPAPPLPEIRTRAALQKALQVERPQPSPIAFAQPPGPAPAPPAPPAAPPPPPPSPAVQATFEQRVLGAIQASADGQMAVLPAAARMMRLSGRARVVIVFRDGALLEARIEQSAGSPLLDGAAMAAVRTARYPQPPPELAGRTLTYALWVVLAVR